MFAIQKGRSNPVRISSKRCENDKVAPVDVRALALRCNAFAQFVSRKPRDADDLISAALAGGNGNGRSRHLQKFRKEFDAALVGSAVYGRRGQGDFERIAEFAGD